MAHSKSPLIITDSAGRDVQGFNNLVALAELFAIPVVESAALYANFPKSHPLYLGGESERYLNDADLVILAAAAARRGIRRRTGRSARRWWRWARPPSKNTWCTRTCFADRYVEGDLTLGLGLLAEALRPEAAKQQGQIEDRRQRWSEEHDRLGEAHPCSGVVGQR